VLSPAPTNADMDAVDGRFTVLVPGWHNPTRPTDVTGDGQVTPLDVLTVIDYPRSRLGEMLRFPASVPSSTYYDVNADGRCTPLDALIIINSLNTQPVDAGAGETAGEWASAQRGRRVDRALEELESLPLDLGSWLPDVAAAVAGC
jgi:hypothetical protein